MTSNCRRPWRRWNQDAWDEAGRGDEVFRYLKSHGLSLYFRDGADVGTPFLPAIA